MITVEDIYEILNHRKVIVYGAGNIASNFLRTLLKRGYLDKVAYVVTKCGEEKEIEGKKVYKLGEINEEKDVYFLIAIHEVSKDESERYLDHFGYKNHIWVTPLIFDIYYGIPTIEQKQIREIWKANKQWYTLATRYLAICDYYGQCENGFDIYKKLLSFYSNEDTVNKRIKNFISLIENFNNNGFDINHPISCLNNNILVDGAHRVALSIYHKTNIIQCKVYDNDVIYDGINTNNIYINRQKAIQMGVKEKDIEILESTNEHISKFMELDIF